MKVVFLRNMLSLSLNQQTKPMKFTVTATLKASPKEIYDAWLNSESHSEMTGGKAKINNQVGTNFTAWDGYIEGTNLEPEPKKRI
jgi:uncharacterized protein YndB with AHSA1/START domain